MPKVNKNTSFLINRTQGVLENIGLAAETIFNDHILNDRREKIFLRFGHVIDDVIKPFERTSYDRKTLGCKEMPGCQNEGQ